MKELLCFGDSNTWGANPSGGRYPWEVRWPGRLQAELGSAWHVQEDGLSGRTSVFDDPFLPYANGLKGLGNSLRLHMPLDVIVLAIGINDCQATRSATPRVVAHGAEMLIQTVRSFPLQEGWPTPKILLICPPPTGPDVARSLFPAFDEAAYGKSLALPPLFAQVAQQLGCAYLDGGTVACASDIDQLHFMPESHAALATAVAEVVRGM